MYSFFQCEQLVQKYNFAEVYAFKANLELAAMRIVNAVDTLNIGSRQRSEPLELLRDCESVICEFSGEKPRVRISKPKNDCFSKAYEPNIGFLKGIATLCQIYAHKRGLSMASVI